MQLVQNLGLERVCECWHGDGCLVLLLSSPACSLLDSVVEYSRQSFDRQARHCHLIHEMISGLDVGGRAEVGGVDGYDDADRELGQLANPLPEEGVDERGVAATHRSEPSICVVEHEDWWLIRSIVTI